MIRHDEVVTLILPHQIRHGHHLQVNVTEGGTDRQSVRKTCLLQVNVLKVEKQDCWLEVGWRVMVMDVK